SFLVLAHRDRSISLVLNEKGTTLQFPSRHKRGIVDVAVSPDGGKLVTVGADHLVKVWVRKDNQVLLRSTFHVPVGRQALFTPDGERLITSSHFRTLKVWDLGADRVQFDIHARLGVIHRMALSPDGRGL